VPGVLEEIMAGEQDGFDAYAIACFGDPGLKAARELARGLVLGIAEAAMHAASFIGAKFTPQVGFSKPQLSQYFCGGQVAAKTLRAGGAKRTTHRTSGLG